MNVKYTLTFYSSLDAALDDDDAAIRVLNNNIDSNGTGLWCISALTSVATMLANLIQDGISRYWNVSNVRFPSKRRYFCPKSVFTVTILPLVILRS